MLDQEVWITGVGVLSALGRGFPRHLNAVKQGECGLRPVELFGGAAPAPILCGLVPEITLGSDLEATAADRATSLLRMSLRDALHDAMLESKGGLDADLLVGTTLGNMHGGTRYYREARTGEEADPALLRDFLPCAPALRVAQDLGLKGRVRTVSSACGSASAAMGQALERLTQGRSKRIIAGGFEALSPYVVAGFASLKLVSGEPCRPLDSRRDGLNPGEGAAVMVLETEQAARTRGVLPLARLSGFGQALEAYHQTRANPEGTGVAAALERCLAMANVKPGEVDCLHLHGTATRANDISEHRACRKVWGAELRSLPVCSTKPMTGHTFGASGALSAVFALATLRLGIVPATLNLEHPDPDLEGLSASPELREIPDPRHVLCTSLGFGGESFAMCLSSPEEMV